MLEPQNWLKEHVIDLLESNPKIKFYAVGAGSQSQRLKFTIAGRDDSSSFIYFTEEQAKNAGYKQIDVDVITLNEFISQNNLNHPDIIKIDAEGFDLEVLKGASNFLGKTEIFMVEAGVVAKHIENSFSRVVEFMDLNGYKLFDITDLNRPFKPSVLWLTELVFIKKNGLIDVRKIV